MRGYPDFFGSTNYIVTMPLVELHSHYTVENCNGSVTFALDMKHGRGYYLGI